MPEADVQRAVEAATLHLHGALTSTVCLSETSREEHLMHVSCAERGTATGTLAVAVGQVRLDALLAKHVPALGDDGVLLSHFAHAAAHERAHVLQLLFHLRAHAVQASLPQLLHPGLQALPPSKRKGVQAQVSTLDGDGDTLWLDPGESTSSHGM